MSRWGAARLARFSNVGKKTITGRILSVLGRIGAIIQVFQKDRARLTRILLISLVLWILHLAQFSFCYLATSDSSLHLTGLLWSRVPMAIFIGLIPISFAGVGTRDAAMLYLLAPTPVGEDAAVLLGVFATFRYVAIALAGLPFVWRLPHDRVLPTTEADFTLSPDLTRRRPTPMPTAPGEPSR
jgi:uncharacterized protein (TIRG00374 family)